MRRSLKFKEPAFLLTGRAKDEDIKALFELLGMLSKADGRVSQGAINETEKFISGQLDLSQRIYAIACFRAGKELPGHSAAVTKRAFHLYGFREQSDVERWLEPLQIIDILLRVALSDGILSDDKEYIIDNVRGTLAVHKRAYWVLRDALAERMGVKLSKNTKSFAKGTADDTGQFKDKSGKRSVTATVSKAEALKILNLEENADIKDIKTSYRALVKLYHPDLISKDGRSDTEIKEAIRNFCQIQEAYEKLITG